MTTTQTNPTAEDDWRAALRESPTIRHLSTEQVESLLKSMQEIPVRAGQIIFRQGERGGHYYVIRTGTARVSRWDGQSEQQLARLGPATGFGEDALIADSPRNATVTMETSGVLMRLSRDDFLSMLQNHQIDEVDYATSRELVRNGALRIDVRSEREFATSGLRGALNLPLGTLREKAGELDPGTTYIVYCDNGERSAAAAFLLSLRGFDARVLRGGLAKAVH